MGQFDDQIPTLPFVSDGCSGGLSWGWKELFHDLPPFQDCCYVHDMEYHYGGTLMEKFKADLQLAKCIITEGVKTTDEKIIGYPVYIIVSTVVFLSVTLGGLAFWKKSYSWGFGWHPEWVDPS